MRQRRSFNPNEKRASIQAELSGKKVISQEERFFNLEGRANLKRQIELLGRGKKLLNKWSFRTPLVKQKAVELSIGRSATQAAINIARFASDIKFLETGNMTATKFYAKQNADDIISGRPIPTFPGALFGIVGCQTVCATMMALLRGARPISGKIRDVKAVRTVSPAGFTADKHIVGMPHTIVSFSIDGVKYISDPFKSGHSFLGTMYINQRGRILVRESEIDSQVRLLKKDKKWKEADDPSDFGITSFEKYVEEAREHGADIAKRLDLGSLLKEL